MSISYYLDWPRRPGLPPGASLLSAELGRPINYIPLSLMAYRRELRRRDLPADYVKVQLVINLIARVGLAAKVNGTVEHLLGRPATPLATYLHNERDRWRTAK